MQILSLSDKRLIIEVIVNNRKAAFLIDTGACVGLIDENLEKKFNLKCKRKYPGTLVGAGGNFKASYICNDIFVLNNKQMSQFITSDISEVQESIRKETGITILGIIGLPQMKLVEMLIDLSTNMISV